MPGRTGEDWSSDSWKLGSMLKTRIYWGGGGPLFPNAPSEPAMPSGYPPSLLPDDSDAPSQNSWVINEPSEVLHRVDFNSVVARS